MSGWPPPQEHGGATEAPGFATALRGGAPRRARRPRDADQPGRWRRLVPTRDALVDAAFAAVLVTIALVGLRTGFLGPQWMVAAGVGLLFGLAIGYLAGVFEWLAVTTLVVLVAVYFLLGGPLAVRTDLVGGVLPTGQTFSDLATWAVLGWKRWLTLLPPVDARGPVLALPWLAGLLGGAVTLGVARRWSNVPLTAVAPLVLLAGSIALGTSESAAEAGAGRRFRRRARRLAGRARPSVEATGAERLGQQGPPRDRRRAHRPRRRGRGAGRAVPTRHERRRPARGGAHRTRAAPGRLAVPQPAARFPALHRAEHRGALRRGRAQGGRAPCRIARPVRHPRRLRRPGLGRGRPQHRRRAVPAGRLPHRPARRRHPGRRHGRRRRRRVRRLLAADGRGADPHRVRRAARRGARVRAVAQPRHRHRGRPAPAAGRRALHDERAAATGACRRAARGPRRRRAARPRRRTSTCSTPASTPGPAGPRARGGSCGPSPARCAPRAPTPTAAPPTASRRSTSRATRRPAEPLRQLHQAGRQRRAVRRHPGAGRAAARHPVAGRHGGRARAERRGTRSRRARLGRGAARRRVAGSRCGPAPSCRAATRRRASSS